MRCPIIAMVLGMIAGAVANADPIFPMRDADGIPLPTGAIARLGSLRWSVAPDTAAFDLFPSGKQLVTLSRFQKLRLYDTSTGLHWEIAIPLKLGNFIPDRDLYPHVHACRDEKTLLISGNRVCSIVSFDLSTGKLRPQYDPQVDCQGFTSFDPLGKRAFSFLDHEKGFEFVRHLRTENGLLTDARVVLAHRFTGVFPGVCPDPKGVGSIDGRWALYTFFCLDQGEIVERRLLIDFERLTVSKSSVPLHRLDSRDRWMIAGPYSGSFLLGRDRFFELATAHRTDEGSQLHVEGLLPPMYTEGGGYTMARSAVVLPQRDRVLVELCPVGLSVLDLRTRKFTRLQRPAVPVDNCGLPGVIDVKANRMYTERFGEGRIDRIDLTTGRSLKDESVGHTHPIEALAFRADGKRLASVSRTASCIWNLEELPTTARERLRNCFSVSATTHVAPPTTSFVSSDVAYKCQFLPNGTIRAGQDDRRAPFWLIDPKSPTIRTIDRFQGQFTELVAPDASCTATILDDRRVRIDENPWEKVGGHSIHTPMLPKSIESVRFSEDSQRLETLDTEQTVCVWDRRTGLQLPNTPLNAREQCYPQRYRLVQREETHNKSHLEVWDQSTARLVRSLPGWMRLADLSADGRYLIHAIDEDLVLTETLTLMPVFRWIRAAESSCKVRVSPTLNVCAVGQTDGTILLYDLRFPYIAPAERAKLATWEARIEALGSPDGALAFQAICVCLNDPAEAVRRCEQVLRDVQSFDAATVRKMIAALDTPRFAEREAATRWLSERLSALEPMLIAARTNAGVEGHARLERILDSFNQPITLPSMLRPLRAVQLLERIGSEPARKSLRFASQLPGETGYAAKDALRRLELATPEPRR